MPDDRLTLTDWLSAQARLAQGRTSDPSQDKLSAADTPAWWWDQQRYRERQTPGLIPRPEDVAALPFGSLGDPVSQAAFLLAPGALQAGKATLAELGARPPLSPMGVVRGARLRTLGAERGNLGPVPRSEFGEALPRSVVRDAEGKLKRLYHGTGRVYPDFDMAQAGSGAGGDLYGPGIYLTDSPVIAESYAQAGQPIKDVLVTGQSWNDTLRALRQQRINPMGQDVFINQLKADPRGEVYEAVRLTTPPANIRPVYADLKRPFDIDAASVTRADLASLKPHAQRYGLNARHWQELTLEDTRFPDYTPSGSYVYKRLEELMGKAETNKLLQDAGYDGITHIGGRVTGGAPHRVYIAFSPEHVYPAPNVEALP